MTLHETHRERVVVLAEDDAAFRALLGKEIQKAGYDVVELGDGAAVVEYLAACAQIGHYPDVLISDNRMPGYHGMDVLEALRLMRFPSPVILITAFGDAKTHVHALQLGAEAVFNKPLDLEDLLATVQTAVDRPDFRRQS